MSARPEPASLRATLEPLLALARSKRLREANEATARVEVVDRVLASVGWQPSDIEREHPSGTGDYLDYQLNHRGTPWLVVEAKRAGRTFDLTDSTPSHRPSSTRSLQGILSRGGGELRDVLKQSARYCNDRGIPLACATNGHQWLFFRGLSTISRPWDKGQAVVFESPDDVLARLDDFTACIGKAWAGTSNLPALLDRGSAADYPQATRPRDRLAARRAPFNPTQLAVIHSISDYLLSDIYGDDREPMLAHCYVQPGISSEFEKSVQRLLKDTAQAVEADDQVLEGGPDDFVEQVSLRERMTGVRHPIIVVGHVGAGKTTFLRKSLATLREGRSAFFGLIDLEGHGQSDRVDASREESRVAQLLIDKLRNAATTALKSRSDVSEAERLQADPTEPDTLRTMFRDSLMEEKRIGQRVWDGNPTEWHRKEYELLAAKRAEPISLLVTFIRHLRARFRQQDDGSGKVLKYPVILVIDNLDLASDDYQRCIYGFVQRLAAQTPAVIIICMREDTYHAGRQPGGFLTSSPLQFVFHVAAPSLPSVLRRRVDFAEQAIQAHTISPRLSHSIAEVQRVCATIRQTALTQRSDSLELIGSLAGHNTRHALDIMRTIVAGSPHVRGNPNDTAEYALDCVLSVTTPDALGARLRIANLFDTEPCVPPLLALRCRLLAYFSWAIDSTKDRVTAEVTETAISRFAIWGYPVAQVALALRSLIDAGLLSSNGFEARDNEELPRRLSLTASGLVHLRKLVPLKSYRVAMATIARWYDSPLHDDFVERAQEAGGSDGPTLADIALSAAPLVFEAYLVKSVAKENHQLVNAIGKAPWIGEVLSRSSQLYRHDTGESMPAVSMPPDKLLKTKPKAPQLNLLPEQKVDGPAEPVLPCRRPSRSVQI